ncbi:MAG: MerR family transcriptional regulator [Burkholderiaceae bacterium]|nr:MerR family transcriptional regulator [Burkholderiaceae bacterium]
MPAPSTNRLSLTDLAGLAELPPRTIRFWIDQGLVPRPEGVRRGAWYTAEHLDAVLTIRRWQQAGLSLERIGELLAGAPADVPPRPRGPGTLEVWSHAVVADGIELTIEPSRAGLSPEQLRALFRGVTALYEEIRENDDND